MAITINVTPAAGGTIDATAVDQAVTLSVTSGIGPVGANAALIGGSGIDVTYANGEATLELNATLATLADVSAAAPTSGQVLAWNGTTWAAADDSANLTGYATESYVDSAVANLVDSSPATLDTLNELAAALGDDANFAANVTASLAGKASLNHTHEIANVAGLQSALDAKAATASLATVATSGNYSDLSGLPVLGTVAATNSTDYATAAQGSLADSAVQPADLATVATTGSYSDLSGTPTELPPASHTHTSGDITDFATAAAANAPVQTVNSLTGDIVIANGTGLTLTESGTTLTLEADLPPSNLADLADVSGSPTTGQALVYNGTEWQPGDVAAGTTLNGLSGALTLAAGDNVTITTSGSTLTFSAAGGGGGVSSLDAGTFPRVGSLLTEGGDNLTSETGDQLALEQASSGAVLQLLRSNVTAAVPTSLADGELAINTQDGNLFYSDASGKIQSFTLAEYAAATHTHIIADVTGLQAALDEKAASASLATVATTGSYSDLSGVPAEFPPASHTHTSSDITDFATAAAAAAPLQSVNSLAGTLTLAAGSGVTITESGSTITFSASAASALDDLTDVDAPTPSSGQVLKWNGTAWAPATDQFGNGTGGGGGYGTALLFG